MEKKVTRCKFRCDQVSKLVGYGKHKHLHSVSMAPVYANNDPNHENSKFWDTSPSGKFELSYIHSDLFEVGKEYYLDISEA